MSTQLFRLTVLFTAMVGVATNCHAERLYVLSNGVTGGQMIASFNTSNLANLSTTSITGLASAEELTSIDFRPLTGQLFGLSSNNAIYTVNTATGEATKVGTGFTDALNGGNFGFDFNPQIDRIRIVSDADQNFVAHPDTGDANVATTTPVAFAAGDTNEGAQPNVVHHAYDGNVFGALASSTQLRAIDTNLDALVTQANNAGTLATIGSLGVDAQDIGGFDVATTGNAFAVFSNGIGAVDSTLYSIDLQSGAATALGTLPLTAWGLAADPIPEPSSMVMVLGTLAIGGWLVRKRS